MRAFSLMLSNATSLRGKMFCFSKKGINSFSFTHHKSVLTLMSDSGIVFFGMGVSSLFGGNCFEMGVTLAKVTPKNSGLRGIS